MGHPVGYSLKTQSQSVTRSRKANKVPGTSSAWLLLCFEIPDTLSITSTKPWYNPAGLICVVLLSPKDVTSCARQPRERRGRKGKINRGREWNAGKWRPKRSIPKKSNEIRWGEKTFKLGTCGRGIANIYRSATKSQKGKWGSWRLSTALLLTTYGSLKNIVQGLINIILCGIKSYRLKGYVAGIIIYRECIL